MPSEDVVVVGWPLHAGVQVESVLQCFVEEPHHPQFDLHCEIMGHAEPVQVPTTGAAVTVVVPVVVVVDDKKPEVFMLVDVDEDVEATNVDGLSLHAAVQIEPALQWASETPHHPHLERQCEGVWHGVPMQLAPASCKNIAATVADTKTNLPI